MPSHNISKNNKCESNKCGRFISKQEYCKGHGKDKASYKNCLKQFSFLKNA
jgi:hypothetical protein